MAGIPKALPLEPGQYPEYPFIPRFLHFPGTFIGNNRDRLRVCPVFPQLFNLFCHPRHMEARQHLDQFHPHFHVGFLGAGFLEICLLFSRQCLKFVAAVNNLNSFFRIFCLFVQLHQLAGISIQVQPKTDFLVTISRDHFPEPPFIPHQKPLFPHKKRRPAEILIIIDHLPPVRSRKHNPCHKRTALAPNRKDSHIWIHLFPFPPALQIGHPVPVLIAHPGIDHRLFRDAIEAGTMGIVKFLFPRLHPIESIIRACAAISHKKQKIPVFFRQPDSFPRLKFLYRLLTGRR